MWRLNIQIKPERPQSGREMMRVRKFLTPEYLLSTWLYIHKAKILLTSH
jgi:hypothetical protein